jgi:hypothetical protein
MCSNSISQFLIELDPSTSEVTYISRIKNEVELFYLIPPITFIFRSKIAHVKNKNLRM